jgi:hypothetical protein
MLRFMIPSFIVLGGFFSWKKHSNTTCLSMRGVWLCQAKLGGEWPEKVEEHWAR